MCIYVCEEYNFDLSGHHLVTAPDGTKIVLLSMILLMLKDWTNKAWQLYCLLTHKVPTLYWYRSTMIWTPNMLHDKCKHDANIHNKTAKMVMIYIRWDVDNIKLLQWLYSAPPLYCGVWGPMRICCIHISVVLQGWSQNLSLIYFSKKSIEKHLKSRIGFSPVAQSLLHTCCLIW